MTNGPFITLDNISVRLRDRLYLHNTSWQINSNEHWAILGPNGSGKSTFAKSLFGEVPVVRGKIIYHFSGKEKNSPISISQAIGYVSSELHRDIIERENLEDSFRDFSGKIDEVTRVKNVIAGGILKDATDMALLEKRLNNITKKMGIESLLERDIKSLSIGEMNIALIVKALIKRPKLLILDEPFDGLDQQARKSLAAIINELMQDNIRVILITHRFEEILPNITHVLFLKFGQVYKSGRKEDIFKPEVVKQVYEIEKRSISNFPQKIKHSISVLEKKSPLPFQNEKSEPARTLIEMKNVTVKYGQTVVLDKFNWAMRAGENWALLGPKGAGKTTVLKLILGDNLQAYANEIYLFDKKRGSGESVWDIKKQIGFISSDLQLRQHNNVNAFDVICSGFFDSNGLYQQCSAEETAIAREWIKMLDVQEWTDKKFGRLSHGQRQLILIARAMVKNPILLILDEPCEGLDIANRTKILDVFEYIGSNTHTNLIYVPNQDEELNCITNILKMDQGKAVDTVYQEIAQALL